MDNYARGYDYGYAMEGHKLCSHSKFLKPHFDTPQYRPYTHFYHRTVKKVQYLSAYEAHYYFTDNRETMSIRVTPPLPPYCSFGLEKTHSLQPRLLGKKVLSIEFTPQRAFYTLEDGLTIELSKHIRVYQDDTISIAG